MLTDQSIQVDYGKLDSSDIKALNIGLTKKVTIINKHLTNNVLVYKLKVRIQQPKSSQYIVDLSLLNSVTLHTSGRANSIIVALENAFNPLRENLLQHINKTKESHENITRRQRAQRLNNAIGSLDQYIQKEDKQSFTKALIPLLEDLKKYIQRRLRFTRLLGRNIDNSIKSTEVVNQVVVQAYENFKNRPKDLSLEHWLFYLADITLEKLFKEAQFEQEHLEDWDKYIEQAIESMDQQMTMSAEGSPELVENLDDVEEIQAYSPDQLGYEVNYTDNLSDKNRLAKILKMLAKLPVSKRSVFDLHTVEGFSISEIAKMKNDKRGNIEAIILEVRNYLRNKLADV